jgi:hypothetical protein
MPRPKESWKFGDDDAEENEPLTAEELGGAYVIANPEDKLTPEQIAELIAKV